MLDLSHVQPNKELTPKDNIDDYNTQIESN